MMLKKAIIGAVVCFGISSLSFADSDGSFCFTDTYIAYERFTETATPGRQLYVVKFSREGISEPAKVLIAGDFQPHGMVCHAARVVIEGWDKSYVIDLSGYPSLTWKEGSEVEKKEAANLGFLAAEGVMKYPLNFGFELVVTKKSEMVGVGQEKQSVRSVLRGPISGSKSVAKVLFEKEDVREFDLE